MNKKNYTFLHVTHDMWHMIFDMLHMIGGEGEPSLKMSTP